MWAVVAQGGITSPFLFTLYINGIPSASFHVELAFYVDYKTVIATSRLPSRFIKYLKT
jgi:hypothetical protein